MGSKLFLLICLFGLLLAINGKNVHIESNDLCDNFEPELKKLVKCSSYRAKRRMEDCNNCESSNNECQSCDVQLCNDCQNFNFDCPVCCSTCQQSCNSNCQVNCNRNIQNCQTNCNNNQNCRSNCNNNQNCERTSTSQTSVVPPKTPTPQASQVTHNYVNVNNRSSSYQNSFSVDSVLNLNNRMHLPTVLNTVHYNTIKLNRTEPSPSPIEFPPCPASQPGNITIVIKNNKTETETYVPPCVTVPTVPPPTARPLPPIQPPLPPPQPPRISQPPVVIMPYPQPPRPPTYIPVAPPPPPPPKCPLQQQTVQTYQVPRIQVPQVQLSQIQVPQVQLSQIQVPQVQVQVPQVQVQVPQVQQPACVVNGINTCYVQSNVVQTVPTSSYIISQQQPSTTCIVNGVNTCLPTQSYPSYVVQPTAGCIPLPGQTTCGDNRGTFNSQSLTTFSTSVPTTATLFQGERCCIITGERQCQPAGNSPHPLCFIPQRWVCGEQCKNQNPAQSRRVG